MPQIVGLTRLEALYRTFVGLDLDKGRAQRILDIATKKLEDLFIEGQQRAWARGSDVVEWSDLPITRGLRQTIEHYRRERERLNDPRLDLTPIVEHLEQEISGLVIGESVKESLQDLAATILLLIGYVIKRVDPKARKPSAEDIERTRQILDLTI